MSRMQGEYTGKLRQIRDRLADRVQTERFLRRAITEVVAPSLMQNIYVQGRPPFAPLAPRTIQMKRMRNQPLVIGIATGAMFGSLEPGAAHNVFRVDGTHAEFGTDLWYATRFHEGDPMNNQPARPFMFLQPQDKKAIKAMFGDWLMEGSL